MTRPGGRIVMGNWIPNDPTLVAQILKISSCVLAAAARRLHQPDDVGDREQRDRAIRGPRASRRRRISFVRDTYTSTSPAPPSELVAAVQEVLRSDDERVRRRGEERPGRRSAAGAGSAVQRARTQSPSNGRHLHSGDLPARDRFRVTRAQSTVARARGLELGCEPSPARNRVNRAVDKSMVATDER